MGWAKYSEDIIKIKDSNLYDKKKFNSFLNQTIGKSYSNQKKTLESNTKSKEMMLKEEIEDIKIRLIQIQTWIEFYHELEEHLDSKLINYYLNFRIDDLEQLKDEYYDLYFDKKFNLVRKDINVNLKQIKKEFLEVIKIDLLDVFVNIFINMRNRNMDEAIELRRFYEDLDEYIKLVNIKDIKIPYIDSVMNMHYNIELSTMHTCSRCGKNMYDKAYICTNCDNDKGE